jgi:hypothetical protein
MKILVISTIVVGIIVGLILYEIKNAITIDDDYDI